VQWGAVAGRSLRFLFVMSAPDRKELLQMSDEDVSRATGSPFAFSQDHTGHVTPQCGGSGAAAPAGGRAADPDPGTRQTRDGPVVTDRATVAAGTPDL
jgi:hypothetical protein